ncbi:MAG: hypothetical protein JSU96_00660 [Acidobacteriota bacterium]|nr:MAG: hypothetical protein JSU96_00660 [Acidobacteriota bacterium]
MSGKDQPEDIFIVSTPIAPGVLARFSRDQQVLMISKEMNRASRLLSKGDLPGRTGVYERVLRLVNLSVQTSQSRSLRRELLCWRDLGSERYLFETVNPSAHLAALRILLQMTPASATQIPCLLGARS